MPTRLIEEKWLSAGFAIEHEEVQQKNPQTGELLFNEDGSPQNVSMTILLFVRNTADDQHVIRIPLDDEARRSLAHVLETGEAPAPRIQKPGILVPGAGARIPRL